MLRKTMLRLLARACLILLDLTVITLIYFSLYLYRISREFGMPFVWYRTLDFSYLETLPYFGGYLRFFAIIVLTAVYFNQRYDLYTLEFRESVPDELWKIAKSVFYAVIGVAALSYLLKIQIFSRLVYGSFAVLTVLGLWAWRLVKRYIILIMLRQGHFKKNLIIVGAGQVGQTVARELVSRPGLGYNVVGFADDDPAKQNQLFHGVRVICGSKSLAEVAAKNHIDEILITIPSERDLIQDIINQCRRQDIQIRIVPEMFNLMTTSVEVGQLGPVPYMRIVKTPMRGAPLILKRLFDVAVSMTAIVFLLPVLIITALAVKVDSPGPLIFKQKRVGKNGEHFDFYKFRSMVVNAEELRSELAAANEADGPVFKIRHDPRVTRVGAFIRKYSIDELPQLFNVLKGDMSLVGPRPPLPEEVEQYGDIEWRRLEVIPGITGLWQVSGRSEVSFHKWMELDVYYIEHWSFWLDLKILLQTIPVVLTGKGAY